MRVSLRPNRPNTATGKTLASVSLDATGSFRCRCAGCLNDTDSCVSLHEIVPDNLVTPAGGTVPHFLSESLNTPSQLALLAAELTTLANVNPALTEAANGQRKLTIQVRLIASEANCDSAAYRY